MTSASKNESLTKLTKRQMTVLAYIIECIDTEGYPPTIREIGNHMSIKSTNGVNDHLKAIERKGYLEREDGKSRALKPLFNPDGSSYQRGDIASDDTTTVYDEGIRRIPVVGRIAAGLPMQAIENTEEFLALGEGLLGRTGDIFGLRVTGESMIDDGIHDGDYIFVAKQKTARNGEIVAAMVEGEATVKRFYREGSRIRLQPANATMDPIYVNASDGRDADILGRVIGVYRKL
ncbi:transcriptional repressor LexA [Bradymonas sediminis]|uniref:LexA repressor n=1 Tax=Bradymonas sediminis TaxID=1548548 RepID=A0A2Z4FL48_9DELT|nr:transcriptional repressor LexA [Bradymonas sediminis]AWV89476.1 repressor LexA [Bradymonas sediminis]TDP76799.1 SOS-response transcriptional repressor LexA [Bradymonas sediminis]